MTGCNHASSSATRLTHLGPARIGFTIAAPRPETVAMVHQVHGTTIVNVQPRSSPAIKADGMTTTIQGLRLAIKTADCLPVLLADTKGQRIAAVHAGWRGLTAGILSRACEIMLAGDDTRPDQLHMAIGPAICGQCFEVGPEVVAALKATPNLQVDDCQPPLIRPGRDDRSFVDLKQAAVAIGQGFGIPPDQILLATECTLEQEHWPSYRRAGRAAGRIYSWIELPESG